MKMSFRISYSGQIADIEELKVGVNMSGIIFLLQMSANHPEMKQIKNNPNLVQSSLVKSYIFPPNHRHWISQKQDMLNCKKS